MKIQIVGLEIVVISEETLVKERDESNSALLEPTRELESDLVWTEEICYTQTKNNYFSLFISFNATIL